MEFKYENMTFELGGNGMWKTPCILANEGTSHWPLVYFRRPKNVPVEVFDELIRSLRIGVSGRVKNA